MIITVYGKSVDLFISDVTNQWRIQDFADKEVNLWGWVEDELDIKIYAKNCIKIYNAVVRFFTEYKEGTPSSGI